MTLDQLREVAKIDKILLCNKETKKIHESEEYSTYGLLVKYGTHEVIRVYPELDLSSISNIDGSISVNPKLAVIIEE